MNDLIIFKQSPSLERIGFYITELILFTDAVFIWRGWSYKRIKGGSLWLLICVSLTNTNHQWSLLYCAFVKLWTADRSFLNRVEHPKWLFRFQGQNQIYLKKKKAVHSDEWYLCSYILMFLILMFTRSYHTKPGIFFAVSLCIVHSLTSPLLSHHFTNSESALLSQRCSEMTNVMNS